jgi:hypothetical protein
MHALVPIGLAAALGTGLYLFEKKKLPGQKPASGGSKGFQQASFAQSSMSVGEVQQSLNALGANPPLAVDGSAGPHTTAAIKSFQQQAGITADGVVGPQTTAALQHALGAHSQVAGFFEDDDEVCAIPESTMVGGPWFLEDDEDDDDFTEAFVGQTMARHVGVNSRAASARGYNVVGQRGRGSRGGGGRSAAPQGIGPQQGYDEGANNWAVPDVQCILSDLQQMSQIGIQQLYAAKAEEAFGPGSAYRYASPLTQANLDAARELATEELGGSSLGGVNLTGQGEISEADIEELRAYANAWEKAGHDAVGGPYDTDQEEEISEVGQFGSQDWSAPDIQEAYNDPEQVGEMIAHSMPYGYALPYAMMPQSGPGGVPAPPMWGRPNGYGNMPVNEPFQGPYPYPGGYPFGPMTAPTMVAPQAPQLGGVQINPATVVPGQGYQFQSQQGRFY